MADQSVALVRAPLEEISRLSRVYPRLDADEKEILKAILHQRIETYIDQTLGAVEDRATRLERLVDLRSSLELQELQRDVSIAIKAALEQLNAVRNGTTGSTRAVSGQDSFPFSHLFRCLNPRQSNAVSKEHHLRMSSLSERGCSTDSCRFTTLILRISRSFTECTTIVTL